jgi:hypothetical protein
MGATSLRCSTGLRCVAALAACLLWGAPSAHAASRASAESSLAVISATWGVVITPATAPTPPYATGNPVTVNGALVVGLQDFTVVSTGTRSPSGVLYRLQQSAGLGYSAAMCATPWSALGCAGGSTNVPFNALQTTPSLVPSNGRLLYLRVSVTVGGAATLGAEAAPPTALTTSA